MKNIFALIVFSLTIQACNQQGDRYQFVVPDGFQGELVISEGTDGVDAFRTKLLHFDANGNLVVDDIDFLNKWNSLNFVFQSGESIHPEATQVKTRGKFYISTGTFNQDRQMKYRVRKE